MIIMKKLITIAAAIMIVNTILAQKEFWGMTSKGGFYDSGTIFKTDSSCNNQMVIYNFPVTGIPGRHPSGYLCAASNGKLYGVTTKGGVYRSGVLFEYNPQTNAYIKKVDFESLSKGESPNGPLVQATNGKLYGLTQKGGAYGFGVLFEYDPVTNTFIKKVDLDYTNKGKYPRGSLILASNGKLYGMVTEGGIYSHGILFEYNPSTNIFIKRVDFNTTNGSYPQGSLMQATNGKLYGMTLHGGSHSRGVIFEYNPTTNIYTKKFDFLSSGNGARGSYGSLVQASNGKLYGMTYFGGAYLIGTLFEYNITTNTVVAKVDFDNINKGKEAYGSLLKASNGKLYGMTSKGGVNNKGVFFEYNPATDNYTKILDFDGRNNGAIPYSSLMQASNGKLYGMTSEGGINDKGVIYEYNITTDTVIKKINFSQSDLGATPEGSLLKASNGKLYGLTRMGGIHGYGVLFEYDITNHSYSKKADFNGVNNGKSPYGSLIQASNGKLYGLTSTGGSANKGVLFEYDILNDTLIKKADFNGIYNGEEPRGSLLQATNGKLYGMTFFGGINNSGTLFEYNIANNSLNKKHDFGGLHAGKHPDGTLIQASNGKLYGTGSGGSYYNGILFEYNTTTDSYSKKINFNSNTAASPGVELTESPNGKLYGVTYFDYSLFEYNPANNTIINKMNYSNYQPSISNSNGKLLLASNGKLYGMTAWLGTYSIGSILEYDLINNTIIEKLKFNNLNGSGSLYGGLIEINCQVSASFTVNPSSPSSSPFNILFLNTSTGYNSFLWNFGDGNVSTQLNPTHTYQYNGTYQITLLATDSFTNITDTAMRTIICNGGATNPCSFTAELTQGQQSATICIGDSFRLSATPLPNITYLWIHNGDTITGATDSIFYAKQKGFYSAILSTGSCSKTTSNSFYLDKYPHYAVSINIDSSYNSCYSDSLQLNATSGFYSYIWNNGKTNISIYVKSSGKYSVTATDTNGCKSSSSVNINLSIANTPKICVVTVVSLSKHNIIRWSSEVSQTIDSFRIYRENTISGVYKHIGSIDYNQPKEFADTGVNVATNQYRYQITAIDTCGNETSASTTHRTMMLLVKAAPKNHWNLIWKPYEGFNYNSYFIYRGADSTNLSLLTTLPDSITSFIDSTNPSGNIYYCIEVISTDTCSNNNSISSHSNQFNTKNAIGTNLNIIESNRLSMQIFPNPNNGNFNLEINTENNPVNFYPKNCVLEIYDVVGTLIHSETLEVKGKINKQMRIEHLSKGVYFITLKAEDISLTLKFLVN